MAAYAAAAKAIAASVIAASALYIHFRGRVRHRFTRQLTDHSTFLAVYNALIYLNSAVPATPYLDLRGFPDAVKLPATTGPRSTPIEAVSLTLLGTKQQSSRRFRNAGQ